MFHVNTSRRSGVVSPRLRTAAAALATLALGACATPQEVAHTRQVAKKYESEVFDLQRQLAEKDDEIRRLNDRYMKERKASLQNAGFDSSVNDRIENLADMIAQMEGPMGDVERFELEGGYLLMIQDRILFDSGSADLGGDGTNALQSIASEIAATPHGTIFVRGHTDSDPVKKPETIKRFPNGNLQLSAERAVSVARFLIDSSAIAGGEVVVMGFGPHKPLRMDGTAEGKRLNRRVEIFVSDPEG
jgi:chemotaxis protein MotB